MEILNLVGLLVIAVCILAVAAANSSCSLGKSHPDECMCVNDTLLCSKQRETEPSFSEISRDVRELTITGYKIEELNTTRLLGQRLINLKKLELSNNGITTVSSDSFWGKDFPVLRSLFLGSNNLIFRFSQESHDVGAFHELSSLTELDLASSLNRDFVHSHNFSDLLARSKFVLRKLVLSGNGMSSLSSGLLTFNSTRNLEELNLSGNALTTILDGTFSYKSMPNLTVLDLSRNRIGTITSKNVEDLQTFNHTSIYLGGNPFQCSCDLVDFIYWIKATNLVEDRESLICQNFPGTPLLNVTAHQIKCRRRGDNNLGGFSNSQYVILCIIFAIIGLLALIILFMRRKDILRFCMQVRQATKEAFDSHQTHYTYSGIQNARRETADSGVASVDV